MSLLQSVENSPQKIRPTVVENYYAVIRQRPDVLEKARWNVRHEGQCLIYQIKPHVSGYPRISVTLRHPKRKVWIFVSTLVCIAANKRQYRKDGSLYVHRMCMNKMCVNPDHLVLRTGSEIRRKTMRLYNIKWD